VPKPAKPVARRVIVQTKNRLASAKLQPSEVGLGWTVKATQKTSPSGPQHFCNRDLAGLKPFARTDTVFERHGAGGVVSQSMSAYPAGQAPRLLAAVRELVGSCDGWRRTMNGVEATYTLEPLDVPAMGDDAVAARLNTSFSFKQQPVTVTSDFVMVREGNVVMYLAQTAPVGHEPATGELATLARTAARKLSAAQ
jgi:PknH-like extracellular domain